MNILIISANPCSKTENNGKTLEAIFSSFSSKNLFQLFFRPQKNNIDFDYCNSYYCVSEVDILKKLLLKSKTCGGEINKINSDFAKSADIFSTLPKNSFKKNPILRDFLWKTNVWRTNNFISWIKNTNANLVFFLGGGNSYIHDISIYISKKLNIPLAVYFTDDYLLTPTSHTLVDRIMKYRREQFFKKSISHAKIRFCIGEEMVKAYSEYFKCCFYPIMNSIEILPFKKIEYKNKLHISYFGGIHLGRIETIIKVAKCIPKNATLNLYTFSSIAQNHINELITYRVKIHKGIQGQDLIDAMGKSHVLLHVESGELEHRALTKYSISTKIPEYLITGRPIIGVGPKEVASIKFLEDKKIGYTISVDDSEKEITEQLDKIFSDHETMKSIGINGYDYAKNNFNRTIISNTFSIQIKSIIK